MRKLSIHFGIRMRCEALNTIFDFLSRTSHNVHTLSAGFPGMAVFRLVACVTSHCYCHWRRCDRTASPSTQASGSETMSTRCSWYSRHGALWSHWAGELLTASEVWSSARPNCFLESSLYTCSNCVGVLCMCVFSSVVSLFKGAAKKWSTIKQINVLYNITNSGHCLSKDAGFCSHYTK